MPESSSPESQPGSSSLSSSLRPFGWSPRQCLLLVTFNLVPFLHVVAVVAVALAPWARWPWRVLAGVLLLYVAPPLLARLLLGCLPIRCGWIALGSRDYFVWWFLLNLQMVFCRFPALEECLRLVPKLYSAWLRLWGARVGRYVYWAAGMRILDRSFLDIGDAVVFGAGVRLNPHVVARNEQGETQLALAPIEIGTQAMVGGYSLLTAGTRIAAGECTRACLVSPPFSVWADGHRQKPDGA
jgi:hypothetical protein